MAKKRNLAIFLFTILPKSFLSRLFGYIARMPMPQFIMNPLIDWYSRKYGVINEYVIPEGGFRNVNHFFTRELKDGARKIDSASNSIVSPVDARIDQFGPINSESIIQAKGIEYSLNDLVPSSMAEKFKNGSFITLYLSPGDYHRIHSPVSGNITGYFNLPGKLFTVQEYMVNGLKGLFSKNERLISYIETSKGIVGVVKVGAMNVGRISLTYSGKNTPAGKEVISNKALRFRKEAIFPANEAIPIKAGEELARFNLGSTVILLFQEKSISFSALQTGSSVVMGEKIGQFIS